MRIPAIALCLLLPAALLANPEYSRRTGKECNYCHPPNSFRLNDAGKYYKEHGKSLKGYVEPKPAPHTEKKK